MDELIWGMWHCQGMTARTAHDQPIRQQSLRAHNLGLVLRHVADNPGPVSRADVAAATGLTKATVSTLVDELLGGRLLIEVAPAPRAGAGRPAVGLQLAPQGPAGLGLEINVDYVAGCVVDQTGAVRQYEVRRSDQRGRNPGEVIDEVASLARDLRRAARGVPIGGAALAVPGLVADGVLRRAPNLGWADLDLHRALRGRPAVRDIELFTVDNEANLAALGELYAWAPATERPSFLYVSGEIGIGAGIVLDGRLFRGGRGYGGELGHVTVDPDGPRCRCGSRGCLEAYANQEALVRDAGLPSGPQAQANLLAEARSGARPALRALQRAGATLGVAAAIVVNLFDLSTVVLGGAYAPLAPWLEPAVSRQLAERVITAPWAPVTVRASVLDETATVVGAAGSIVRAIRDEPAGWLGGAPT